jgi:hypothetical protein
MNRMQTPEPNDFLEKGRNIVLNAGYYYVVWKSKAKKNVITLKKRVLLFYF